MIQSVQTYQDSNGRWRWRIIRPADEVVIAEAPSGRTDRTDMLNDLFGLFFGSFDETYLTLYAEWNPAGDGGQLIGQQPSVEEQAGA